MYKIQVKRKKVKNITIRVCSENLVTVTAPLHVSDYYINKLLEKKSKWIDERIGFMKNINKDKALNYLGKSYEIKIINREDERIVLSNDKAYIYTKNTKDYYIENIIKEWHYSEAKKIFYSIVKKYENITGKKVSIIRIKPMKTRWGSCNTVKAYVNLNLSLIEKPLECIEYVILHEIAHLTHPNHSKEFWNYVGSYMYDFKERREKLNYLNSQ